MTSQQQSGQAADTTTSDTTYACPWCFERPALALGDLCARCQQEPDAVEFKAWHDAHCVCMAGRDTAGVPAGTPARNSPGHGNGDQ